MTALGLGDPAPDLALLGTHGAPARLGSFRGEATLLIFLRHLG